MPESPSLTNKSAYEAEDKEQAYTLGRADHWSRWRQTLRFVPAGTRSLLDAGCNRGLWLDYVTRRRGIPRGMGIDISESRVQESRTRFPHLEFKAAYLEQLDLPAGSFEVVTCLEVLEHVPQWEEALNRLVTVAQKRVVVTVPYLETPLPTVCIHCGQITPLYGHLRRYDESTFPQLAGCRLTLGYIKDYGLNGTLARRIYRMVRPARSWLVACYELGA